ncbi:sugar O-acyltransferase, sialic acid O-acetyltransferase NeuD family [Hymenobacter gelipurpurascens]|uniref:Sugar O-acyltransferase, sialic acid O-acetyltransferase NeuD family n=1 Tax=Hymenobacter gelipurpurascens TaxID=89968 RepID=A0A212TQ91_9BACT|nr:acetyltransferase [Hymenobacter gelipurpurascens]SNC67994.1 sugar O-acyltransferase, sialic acid O-acetyltransferase NeuD family [Hymenobacter gelipurpurascens]
MTTTSASESTVPLSASPLPQLVILGAGGLGREVLVLARQINEVQPTWEIKGFYDDQSPVAPTIHGLPYLGTSADLNAIQEPLQVVIAVGNGQSRAKLVNKLTSPLITYATLVHPGVACRPYQQLQIGAGCIIGQGCILTCDIRLGHHVLLNLGCTIGHDAVLEDFCSLMPHANVGGEAHLETGVYLGTNATIINQVRVGARTIIGAGAVAVRDVPADCTAVGVPAQVIKRHAF